MSPWHSLLSGNQLFSQANATTRLQYLRSIFFVATSLEIRDRFRRLLGDEEYFSRSSRFFTSAKRSTPILDGMSVVGLRGQNRLDSRIAPLALSRPIWSLGHSTAQGVFLSSTSTACMIHVRLKSCDTGAKRKPGPVLRTLIYKAHWQMALKCLAWLPHYSPQNSFLRLSGFRRSACSIQVGQSTRITIDLQMHNSAQWPMNRALGSLLF